MEQRHKHITEDSVLNSKERRLKYSKQWHTKSAEEREPYYDIVRTCLVEKKKEEAEMVVKEEETVAKTGAKKK